MKNLLGLGALLLTASLLAGSVGLADADQAGPGQAAVAKKCQKKKGGKGRGKCKKRKSVAPIPAPSPTPAARFSLSVDKAGDGSGTVTSDTGGINCGATCSATYDSGTTVTLTANPEASSTFLGWTGGGCAGTGTCIVAVSAATNVGAYFIPAPEYAYIFNTASVVIPLEGEIPFDSNGPISGITHTAGSSQITFSNAGTYTVAFSISAVEANQFAAYVNGNLVAGSISGSGGGAEKTTGQVIVSISAGDVLSIRNTSATPVTVQALAGEANASVVIERLD